LDLAMSTSHGFRIHRSDGTGGFSFASSTSVGGLVETVGTADLDEDGHLDVVVTENVNDALVFLLGDGTGAFHEAGRFVVVEFPEHDVQFGDFDRDGHTDVAVVDAGDAGVAVLLNRTFHPIRCRAGNVNAASGSTADVLFVNGSPGEGPERRAIVDR